ncbi:hypothetical protein BpHYR1_027204 [Brachionus plicatilis]|uniref:Uncharacterized protein n=1 Tax=Brachionus plicatilis TaxID=10195 RepID=A0A3M7PKS9_BRAPC|nr:hypothetical protein BpHYR1_027204 [Brachionus plicatilis]
MELVMFVDSVSMSSSVFSSSVENFRSLLYAVFVVLRQLVDGRLCLTLKLGDGQNIFLTGLEQIDKSRTLFEGL